MNIQTVLVNLSITIAGKGLFLETLHPNNPYAAEFLDDVDAAIRKATIEFLKINIAELKRIHADLLLV